MSYELHINLSDMNSPYRIMTKKTKTVNREIFYRANNIKDCWRDDVKNLGQSYMTKVCAVCCVYVCVQNVANENRRISFCFTSLVRTE